MFGSSKNKSVSHAIDSAAGKQIDTVIAEQCTLEGDLTTKNSIKVDGRIQGTLRADGRAIIGETGVVKGDVYAADLVVLGRLEGNVHAQRLHLQASAQIHGNIEAETLQVDPGARYQGSVTMRDAGAAAAALPFTPSPAAVSGDKADKAAAKATGH
ncbi:bactofilin family protein [Ottowia testudinis]|uniref:Polymer-forming cytoskeletal protein n=1 Tax=Ottowia testudinis TaxID=2816950 RepID=A0A975CDR6_9BURK|nr:polymer-forming cytoskeletal protein [Ottowia testudinis]QTD43881.1 polymer-forming cytoskeletal protein [Ottowia testudinis]